MPQQPQRIEALDALRGLLALAVALYHLLTVLGFHLQGSDPLWQRGLAKFGAYGVQSFFILSGFAFFQVHGDLPLEWRALGRFALQRFLRLAPLFYLVMGLNLLFALPAASFATPRLVGENLLLLFGFIHPNHALVTGGWSIGVEVVFYVAFPLLALLGRRGWPWLVAVALALLAWSWGPNMRGIPDTVWWNRFHAYVQVRNHAFLFLLGGLAVELRRRIPRRFPAWAWLVATTLLLLAMVLWRPHFETHLEMMSGSTRYGLAGLCWALVILASLSELKGLPGRGLLTTMGDLSYGIYLLHPPVILAVLSLKLGPAATLSLSLGLTLALAWASRRWIEKPAMGLAKRPLPSR